MLELEIQSFRQLAEISKQDGYINTLTKLYLFNNYVKYDTEKHHPLNELCKAQQSSSEYLLRNELTTLYALMCKGEINKKFKKIKDFQLQYDNTLNLCEEIHNSIKKEIYHNVKDNWDDLKWREVIYYGTDTAHSFQLLDFFYKKYINDNNWFLERKGFSISDAISIHNAIEEILQARLVLCQEDIYNNVNEIHEVFIFNAAMISEISKIDLLKCSNFMQAFCNNGKNNNFNKIDDFNICKAYPFLNIGSENYYLPSLYMLLEALYETPYYWMISDETYNGEFSQNRGAFTENLSTNLLAKVFGSNNVYKNIEIYDGKKRVGEIDVLVDCGEIALLVQAKSKKMSLNARQGVLETLKKDFKLAVQHAYDQAFQCALDLVNVNFKVYDAEKKEVEIHKSFKRIFPICIVSECYPSLTLQAKDFLIEKKNNFIEKPYVMDVFFLDILCEYLTESLFFISYIYKRVNYSENLITLNEFSILGFHLLRNLFFRDDDGIYHLDDSFSVELDVDFLIRRTKVDLGADTKEFKLLSVYRKGYLGELLVSERKLTLNLFNLYMCLLSMSEKSWDDLNNAIGEMFRRYDNDHDFHSVAFPIVENKSGITFCIDTYASAETIYKLNTIVEMRKYLTKADKWFAVILSYAKPFIENIFILDNQWIPNVYLEMKKSNLIPVVGRNDSCPCGSGKKYKKCCI